MAKPCKRGPSRSPVLPSSKLKMGAGKRSWIHVGFDSSLLLAKAGNGHCRCLPHALLAAASSALRLHLSTPDAFSQWSLHQAWRGLPVVWNIPLCCLLLLSHWWVFIIVCYAMHTVQLIDTLAFLHCIAQRLSRLSQERTGPHWLADRLQHVPTITNPSVSLAFCMTSDHCHHDHYPLQSKHLARITSGQAPLLSKNGVSWCILHIQQNNQLKSPCADVCHMVVDREAVPMKACQMGGKPLRVEAYLCQIMATTAIASLGLDAKS